MRQRRGTRARSIQPDSFAMEERHPHPHPHPHPPSTQPSRDRERAYRYVITEATGCLSHLVGIDAHVIDWEYYGRRHVWMVVNRQADVVGSMTGTYLDKGAVVEGRYIPINGPPE